MDIAALLSAGGGGLLVVGFIYLLAGNRADRQQYEDLVDRAEARAAAVETRERVAQAALDEEMRKRRSAEDEAADLRRKLRDNGGGV